MAPDERPGGTMDDAVRYSIDDTELVRPHVRLCHLMLRSALTEGFTAVELTCPPDEMPTARSQRDGRWEWYMAFPPPVYGLVVAYLKRMAGVAEDAHEAEAKILVRLGGRNGEIALTARANDRDGDELVLRFPERWPADAD